MQRDNLAKLIKIKSQELTKFILNTKASLLDKDVYQKSCELDELIVKFMRDSQRSQAAK